MFNDITEIVDVNKLNSKKKANLIDDDGNHVTTEEYFKNFHERNGWKVLRGEVSLWEKLFCLSFWDVIFHNHTLPTKEQWESGQYNELHAKAFMENISFGDIPKDIYTDSFYLNKKDMFDNAYKDLLKTNIKNKINETIETNKVYWTRLIYNHPSDSFEMFNNEIFQEFLEIVPNNIFADTVRRLSIDQNMRAGTPDFIIWKENNFQLVEVKRINEQLRDNQIEWINWFLEKNYPIKIFRINPI